VINRETEAIIGHYVFVPGEVQPKGSTKSFATKTGKIVTTDDNPDTKPWQAVVASFVRQVAGPIIVYPEGPVRLDLSFVMKRRVAEPKRVTPPHTRKPDLDKLVRAILDSLTGLIYADDNQVTCVNCDKYTAAIGEQPGVHIFWEAT